MYTKLKFRDSTIIFTSKRHRTSEHTKHGLRHYEIRHSDEDWGEPVSVEDGVFVNFFGTILSKDKLDLNIKMWNNRGMIDLDKDEAWDFDSSEEQVESLDEYLDLVGGIDVKIYLGVPTIVIDDEEYLVGIFDRDTCDLSFTNMAYIFNEVVLPVRGYLGDVVGETMKPGIYKHHEHMILIMPKEDMEEYSISNIRGQ